MGGGYYRWILQTVVPKAWAKNQAEWVCLFEIGLHFPKAGRDARCDRRSDLSASSESRIQLAFGSLACVSRERQKG